jgi:hypothetical protein
MGSVWNSGDVEKLGMGCTRQSNYSVGWKVSVGFTEFGFWSKTQRAKGSRAVRV